MTGISSRSHAWGGTPTFDLSTEILGVRPTGSGFATFQVAPHPVDLAWAEGVVPSPHGDIEVVWRIQEDLFTITVVVPEGALRVVRGEHVDRGTDLGPIVEDDQVSGAHEPTFREGEDPDVGA